MRAVSNTSPLLNLGAIGQAHLFRALFSEVTAPHAVRAEIDRLGHVDARFVAAEIDPFVRFLSVGNIERARLLGLHLDPGEAEAIALAVETSPDVVLLDERRARRTARVLGLRPLGVVGLLLLGKRRGHVVAIGPLLDDLASKAGFWMGDRLRDRALREAGEA